MGMHRNVETGFMFGGPSATAFSGDPLEKLLIDEGNEDEAETLASYHMAGQHRTATYEREKNNSDLLGASPFEAWLAHRDRYEEQ